MFYNTQIVFQLQMKRSDWSRHIREFGTTSCTQCYQTPFHVCIGGWVTRLQYRHITTLYQNIPDSSPSALHSQREQEGGKSPAWLLTIINSSTYLTHIDHLKLATRVAVVDLSLHILKHTHSDTCYARSKFII